jgi:hypothetical protein
MKIQFIPNVRHKWDRIVVTLEQIYPKTAMFSGKHGNFGIYTAPTLFKYENIKPKKKCAAEPVQYLNYRIKS